MKPFTPQNFQTNDQENQQNFYNPQQQGSSGNMNFYNPQQESQETNQNFYNPQQQGNMNFYNPQQGNNESQNFYNPQQQQQQQGTNFQNPQQQGNQTSTQNFYNPQQGNSSGSQNFYNPQQQQQGNSNFYNPQQQGNNQTNFQTSQQTPSDQFFIPKNNSNVTTKGPPPMMMNSTTESFFDPNEKKIAPPPTNVTWDPQQQNQGNLTEITHKLENLEVSENFTEVDLNNQEQLPRPTFNKYNSFVPQPDVSPLFKRFNVKGEEPIDYSNTQASSCFCRATVQTVANTPQLLTQWSLPFGVILKPFSDEETPLVHNFKSTGPIRCFNCKAYINPFVLFIEDGRKWQCNMCKSINQGKKKKL
jgi:protein transport protein SEC24